MHTRSRRQRTDSNASALLMMSSSAHQRRRNKRMRSHSTLSSGENGTITKSSSNCSMASSLASGSDTVRRQNTSNLTDGNTTTVTPLENPPQSAAVLPESAVTPPASPVLKCRRAASPVSDEEAQLDTTSPTRGLRFGNAMGNFNTLANNILNAKKKKDKHIDRVRLVKRNLGHYQSTNELDISYVGHDSDITSLLSRDWFHYFLSMNTASSVMLFLTCWTFVILIFAIIYRSYDNINPDIDCGLGSAGHPIEFGPAFAFSLETCTTVGYGLPSGSNSFFESECTGLQFFIYVQMVVSMMFNAFLFAFFFSRLARCETRGLQVLFANKAIVRQIRRTDNEDDDDYDDRWLFQTRLYDLNSRRPLVEAHIRLYLVSYEKHYRTQEPVQVQPLELIDPSDDKGAVLYPSVPCKITHHINEFSPLNPRTHESITKKNITSFGLTHQFNQPDREPPEFSTCPVCGHTFDTLNSLQRHILYSATREKHEGLPESNTHRDESLVKEILEVPSTPPSPPPPNFTKEELRDFLRGKEIVAVLEGIEPIVSGTFQAIQSYKAEDIVFGQAYFEPCMTILPTVESKFNNAKGSVAVDMVKFHTVIDEEDGAKRFDRQSSPK